MRLGERGSGHDSRCVCVCACVRACIPVLVCVRVFVSWQYENDKDAFTITSLVRLTAGNQVFDSYGKKCNSRFLLNYGFAVEDNRDADGQCHNEIRVVFALRDEPEDPLRRHRETLLASLSTCVSCVSTCVCGCAWVPSCVCVCSRVGMTAGLL